MIVGKECRTNEHKQRPDGNTHQHTDISSLLGFLVVFGSQVALNNRLIGAIFLQSIEDTVQHHHEERQLREVPVVGAKRNLVVLRGNAERLCWSAINAKHQDENTDDASSDE